MVYLWAEQKLLLDVVKSYKTSLFGNSFSENIEFISLKYNKNLHRIFENVRQNKTVKTYGSYIGKLKCHSWELKAPQIDLRVLQILVKEGCVKHVLVIISQFIENSQVAGSFIRALGRKLIPGWQVHYELQVLHGG